MVGSRTSTFLRDGALAGGSALFGNAGTYAFYAASAHMLGPAPGGLFLALVAATLLGSMAANIAGVALTPDVSRLFARDERGQLHALGLALARWWAIASIAFLVLGFALAPAAEALFHVSDARPLAAAALALCANALLLVLRAFVQGIGRFDLFAWSNVAETFAKAGAAVAIFRLPSLLTAMISFAAALAVATLVTAALTWCAVRGAAPRAYMLTNASGARSLVAALTALTALTFCDGIIARHVLSPMDAGLYNAAALAGRALMAVLSFMPTVILAKVVHREDGEDSLAPRAYLVAGAACIGSIGVFALFPGPILIAVGGRAFLAGAPLVALYGIAAAALSMANIVAAYRIGRGAAGVGRALLVVAALEITAMLVYHPSASGLVLVVIVGHLCAFAVACASSFVRRERRTIVTT